jgi:diaminopimelate epimerase
LKIDFSKMSGAGNDFIVLDNRSAAIKDNAALAKLICDRHWSVGADGLLLLEASERASYRMMYYNADGSYGGMCGNGGRCIAMYAYLHQIAQSDHTLEALDHIYSVSINSKNVSIHMKNPILIKLNRYISIGKKKLTYHSIDTGAPHVIIQINEFSKDKDLDRFDVQRWGRELRWHKKFSPAGTNVNFIKVINDNSIYLRTYERGVETETLACGTGSVAAAIIAYKKWKLNTPLTVFPTSKIPLIINFDEVDKTIQNVVLTGPAIITFTGSVDVAST